MQDIFGQVHWRTLTIFDVKKAPESCDAGAFCLADYSVAAWAVGCSWAFACS